MINISIAKERSRQVKERKTYMDQLKTLQNSLEEAHVEKLKEALANEKILQEKTQYYKVDSVFDKLLISNLKQFECTPTEFADVETFCDGMFFKENKMGSRDRHNNDFGPHRWWNQLVGKCAEFGASRIFGGTPDLRVWATASRGASQFEPDLVSTFPKNIHVKCCHAKDATPESASWTIDLKDTLKNCPQANDCIVLMFGDIKGRSWLFGTVMAKDVMNLYKPARVLKHKHALYYPDLIASGLLNTNFELVA